MTSKKDKGFDPLFACVHMRLTLPLWSSTMPSTWNKH